MQSDLRRRGGGLLAVATPCTVPGVLGAANQAESPDISTRQFTSPRGVFMRLDPLPSPNLLTLLPLSLSLSPSVLTQRATDPFFLSYTSPRGVFMLATPNHSSTENLAT